MKMEVLIIYQLLYMSALKGVALDDNRYND